ncbi:MAG: hypothetical protein EPGJADBJ_05533 [Saprospiraceae bacterium]|nr:hypothetical protein [Saprospiraceae bacterium]
MFENMQKCIKPGCELLLSLDLSSQVYSGTAIPGLQVWGSESRPCPAAIVNPMPIAFDCGGQTVCSPNDVFIPTCVFSNIPAPNSWGGDDTPNFGTSGQLSWLNQTSQDVCFLTFVNPMASPSSSKIFLDNIVAEIRCEPEIECTATPPIELCEGAVTADVSFQVCATEVPEYADFSTITPTVTLPMGWTVIGGDPLPFTLTTGQCMDINLQVQIPPGTPIGTIGTIELSGTATGLCTEIEWSCETSIEVIDCGTPAFSCPCTTANSLNIDAGTGTNVSDIPVLNNLPVVNGALTLDPDQYGNCIAISGRLIVDKNLSILDPVGNGESFIYMQPRSEIIINGAKRLSMQSLDIEGCDIMWRGITVEPFGRLSFIDNRIADAQFAIKAIPNGPAGLVKPTSIFVQRNRFERNHVGVLIEQGPPSGQLAHMPFLGNQFYSTGVSNSILPSCDGIVNWDGQYGYAGVVALNQQFTVGINNKFDKLRNGVIAENCDLEVQKSTFLNIIIIGASGPTPSYASSEGIGVLANGGAMTVGGCEFNKMYHAMYATDNPVEVIQNEVEAGTMLETHGSWSMKVEENNPVKFTDFGITAQDISPVVDGGFNGYTVGNNYFYSSNTFFDLNDRWAIEFTNEFSTDPPNAVISDNYIEINDQIGGIQVSNINGWQMHYNDVRFLANPSGQDITASGIVLDNSSYNYLYDNRIGDALYNGTSPGLTTGFDIKMSGNNTYCCNISDGPAKAFQFSGSCFGTDFRHNWMEVNNQSLICTDATELSVQADKGNHFDFTAGPAAHGGTDVQVQNSQFIVFDENMDDEVNDVPYSPTSFSPQFWFDRTLVDAGDCANDNNCMPPDHYESPERNIDSKDIETANGIYENTIRGHMLYWEARRNLYSKLQRYPELQGENTAVDAFFAAAATDAIGQHDAADEAVRSVYELPQSLINQLQSVQTVLSANHSVVNVKLSELSQVSTWEDSLAIYGLADSIRLLFTADLQVYLDLMTEVRQLRRANALLALTDINALPASNVLESNRKTVYQIYLTVLAQGVRQLTTSQFDAISDIANQCPLEGGNGVFLARALYQYNDRKHFDDLTLCGTEERSALVSNYSSSGLVLIPNPTSGVVDIRLDSKKAGQEVVIQFYNITGQQVLARSVAAGADGVVRLDVSALPDGLYFCGVTMPGNIRQSARLLIQH